VSEINLNEARQAARAGDTGAFVRGYFLTLENLGIPAAALHGWQDGFSGELSDVDFVLLPVGFENLVEGIESHARECGWRLCQVLRHESTAAFCVCSWDEDPSRVVALDACSDYRRLERILISVDELLADREKLDCGGYRLGEAMELRYRFIKAAVKGKRPEELAPEFAAYPSQARIEIETWLLDRWGLKLEGWGAHQLDQTWKRLGKLTLEGRKSGVIGSLRRVAWRITRPTGLIVTNVNADQDAAVVEAFSRLYFRRCEKVKQFQTRGLKKLMVSTLMRCERIGGFWKRLLDGDLWIEASPNESPSDLVKRITAHLHQRCMRREGVTIASQ
jgi:hypothetical protein